MHPMLGGWNINLKSVRWFLNIHVRDESLPYFQYAVKLKVSMKIKSYSQFKRAVTISSDWLNFRYRLPNSSPVGKNHTSCILKQV